MLQIEVNDHRERKPNNIYFHFIYRIENIPTRTNGCRDKASSEGGLCQYPWTSDCPSDGPSSDEWFCRAVTYNDAYTQEIGRGFITEFESLTGKTPYLVISNLHRSRLDPNRPINRAAQVLTY